MSQATKAARTSKPVEREFLLGEIARREKPTVAQEAIATADGYLSNAVLPTYSELAAALADLLTHCANRGVNTGSELDHGTVKAARALLDRQARTLAGDFRG